MLIARYSGRFFKLNIKRSEKNINETHLKHIQFFRLNFHHNLKTN